MESLYAIACEGRQILHAKKNRRKAFSISLISRNVMEIFYQAPKKYK